MAQYCTTEEVADSLNWSREIPEFVTGEEPTLETVDDSGTISAGQVLYLDHNRVIDGSYTLYYGSDSSNITALIEDTDYTLDKDKGKITITSDGATKIDADSVFAEYKYIEIDGRPGVRDSTISQYISSASSVIDDETNQSFGSVQTKVKELQKGKGQYDKLYRPKELPVFLVETELSSDITSSDTTITVESTTDLQADMYLAIGTEALKVDSVDDATTLTVTRGTLGSTATEHSSGDTVVNFVLQISITPIGSASTYNTLSFGSDYSLNRRDYSITLLHTDITSDGMFVGSYPEQGVPDRFRATYSYGWSDTPAPIKQAAIMSASNKLVSFAVAKGLSQGVDGFTPRANEILDKDFKKLIKPYTILKIDGF